MLPALMLPVEQHSVTMTVLASRHGLKAIDMQHDDLASMLLALLF